MIRCPAILSSIVCCALAFACHSPSHAPGHGGAEGVDGTKAADGVAIHYRVTGTEHGDPTIVFVHGFGCDSSIFDAALAHVSERWRAVALDLPGHGQSGSNRLNWTMKRTATTCAACAMRSGHTRSCWSGTRWAGR
jgi:hypothetical protein